jgi:fibronectin type 3 domain-containing protein
LTAEENLAINPPPPTDVRVVDMTEASVEIRWDPPPSVSGAHHYSDKVVAYRIYRRAGGHLDFRPLAVTAATTYTDRKVKTDHSYEYVVSSVHRHHVEGSRSDPPAIATIGP